MSDGSVSCVRRLSECDWVVLDPKSYGRDHQGKGQQVWQGLYDHMSLSPPCMPGWLCVAAIDLVYHFSRYYSARC